MKSFDFIVIGGGSAGYAAARTAVAEGLSTAVIDCAEELGGLCILRGCMPSKTLIESANRNLTIRHAAEFGLAATSGEASVTGIRDRKRTLIADFAGYRQGQLQDGRFTLIRGAAQFRDATTVEVQLSAGGSETVKFSHACIATGSSVSVPEVPGLRDVGFWTSDDILDAAELPASFVVLGGGAIALEMAHYLEALGRKVTVIQRSAGLLSSMDAECGRAVEVEFKKRGMTVQCGAVMTKVTASPAGKTVHTTQGAFTADEILVATGRSARLEELGLAAAGVEVARGKVKTNASMQTTAGHIFAAGDVTEALDVVHIAIQDAEVAARNAGRLATGKSELEVTDHRLKLFGVFCEPQVAFVGSTEAELHAAGVPFASASYPFNDHGKSMIMGVGEGFVKMIAHQHTGEILGASVVGPEATELIHEVVVAMHFRSTAKQFMTIPHYHPTLSEIWTYPAEELAETT